MLYLLWQVLVNPILEASRTLFQFWVHIYWFVLQYFLLVFPFWCILMEVMNPMDAVRLLFLHFHHLLKALFIGEILWIFLTILLLINQGLNNWKKIELIVQFWPIISFDSKYNSFQPGPKWSMGIVVLLFSSTERNPWISNLWSNVLFKLDPNLLLEQLGVLK